MKVLVIGQGGREHALCWKIRQSPLVTHLFCAPGSAGIGSSAKQIPISVEHISRLVDFASTERIDLTVVGPELPLSLGIVDAFQERGLRIFGPRKSAAALESSKIFSKEVMLAAKVPTPQARWFSHREELTQYCGKVGAPLVLKSDGLASGKGVFVCLTEDEIEGAISQLFGKLGAREVLAEECLFGVEASFIVATDGERIVPLAPAHDYKRLQDGNRGPNTGGMGSVSPTPNLNEEQARFVIENVFRPVLKELRQRGIPYSGFLYAGLLIPDNSSPKVLEFNARLGDPETQSILRRMSSDIVPLFMSLTSGSEIPAIDWSKETSVCLVFAAANYPDTPRKGDIISGIEMAESFPSVVVYHAGTEKNENGEYVTGGGRVLNVTATGDSLEEALGRAYRGADMIQFAGRQLRRDIGKGNG
jgi:phosphoribosylamine---glycine ligase